MLKVPLFFLAVPHHANWQSLEQQQPPKWLQEERVISLPFDRPSGCSR
jgi:hypothetical protein